MARQLVEAHYDALVEIARAKRRRARLRDTLATSDLLHESLIKVSARDDWASAMHFLRAVALAMRHVIVDHARRKLAVRRGGGAAHVAYEEGDGLMPEFGEDPEEIVIIADLIDKLRETRPRWMRIVDARYFGGMTEEEAAEALGLSRRTVRRDWQDVRAWLAEQMGIRG